MARSPDGKRMIKYTFVSVISVIVSQVVLGVLLFGFHWSGRNGQIAACSVATVPSYYLNRAWAWGKRGRSHWLKEVVPFWALAFLGWLLSTLAVALVEQHVHGLHRAVQSIVLQLTNIAAFGVLWGVKFIIFNELLFKQHPEVLEDEPALDGRAGIPG